MNPMKFDTRQKTVLILLILAVMILIWQAMQFYSNRNTVAVTTGQTANNNAPNISGVPANNMSASAEGAAVNPNSNAQSEYLRLVNEYQVAQLQRMIAEDNEAIAVARRNAAQAMQDTSKLVGGDPGALTMDNNSSSMDQNTSDYSLVYTGQQGNGDWTATLKKDGRTYDVITGGQLPDGSQVSAIDENGVLLIQGNNKKLITFSGIIQANTQISTKTETNGPVLKSSQPLLPPQSNANLPQKIVQTNTATTAVVKPVVPTNVVVSNPVVKSPVSITKNDNSVMAEVNSLVDKIARKMDPAAAIAKTPVTPLAPVVPVNNYTVQLMENKNLIGVNNFITEHNLGKEAHYYIVYNKQGEKRYVLTYGAYATSAAAETAMEKLANTIKEKGIFVVAMDTLTNKNVKN